MSLSLDKLRMLQRQTGRKVPEPRGESGAICPVPNRAVLPDDAQASDGPMTDGGSPQRQNTPPQPSPSLREREGAKVAASLGTARLSAPSLCEARGGLGRGAPAPAPAPASTPADTRPFPGTTKKRNPSPLDGLRRLLAQRERSIAPAAATYPRPASTDRALPGSEIAPGLRLVEAFLPQPVPRTALSLAFAKRDGEHVRPQDLLFFDTETTGLAGGTGTRAFMIGAADWVRDGAGGEGLRVRQLLMTTMAAEAAMLETFAGWLSDTTVLSSYNGRCYDAPLLKTRYRLARRGDPITPLDHVDLLFPTRRRYRGTWENCRLATIERQLLRIMREDDLPGSEAPAAWLNYLRGGSARNLRRVAEHNHQDVVTLALLMQRLVAAEAEERAGLQLRQALAE